MNFLYTYETRQNEYVELEYKDGKICIIKNHFDTVKSTKIGLIKISIEYPKNMLGTIRILNVKILDQSLNDIHDENRLIDNSEFYEKDSIREYVASFCNVNVDIVEIV